MSRANMDLEGGDRSVCVFEREEASGGTPPWVVYLINPDLTYWTGHLAGDGVSQDSAPLTYVAAVCVCVHACMRVVHVCASVHALRT